MRIIWQEEPRPVPHTILDPYGTPYGGEPFNAAEPVHVGPNSYEHGDYYARQYLGDEETGIYEIPYIAIVLDRTLLGSQNTGGTA